MAHRKPKTKREDASGTKKKDEARRKNVAPARATSGSGYSFERRVQAHRLLAMCIQDRSCPGVPTGYRITGLQFQTRVHDTNTDDLTCFIENDHGEKARVLMQMKQTLRSSEKDKAFKEAVGLAWLDFKQEVFSRGKDSFNIVYGVNSGNSMRGAAELARLAEQSITVESWIRKATAEGYSNPARRDALKAIRTITGDYNKTPVGDEELLAFMQHVKFLHHDLDTNETTEVKTHQRTIEIALALSRRQPPLLAAMVWSELLSACDKLNADSGELDLDTAKRHIGEDLDFRFKIFASAMRLAAAGTQGDLPPLVVANTLVPGTPTAPPALVASPPSMGASSDLIPAARPASASSFISRRLDRINEEIKACRFADALKQLRQFRDDLDGDGLDAHQEARWHLMRGTCVWTLEDDEKAAAEDFLKAAALYEDDDKLAAARIRGLFLKGEMSKALEAGEEARRRFPRSIAVWVSFSNARTLNNEVVTVADIPAEHRDKAVAYQIAAASLHKAGDFEGAVNASLEALRKEDVSFFAREAALRFSLEVASASPLHTAYRTGDRTAFEKLEQVVREFTPRRERLWSAQIPSLLEAAVIHLAYALLLLCRPEQALAAVEEAVQNGVESKSLIRVRIEALRDAGREQDALAFGEPLLKTMPLDALVAFAQTAANEDDTARVEAAVAAGRSRLDEDDKGTLAEDLSLFELEYMLRTGRAAEIVTKLEAEDAMSSAPVPVLVIGARALLQEKNKDRADEYTAKALQMALGSSVPQDKYWVAQLLFSTKRYAEAASLYEHLVPPGGVSELHTNLLACYLHLGLRAKARELLSSFPSGWEHDKAARYIAIDLGQQVGDWGLLESLVQPQLSNQPERASSHLFAVFVAAHCSPEKLDALAATFPAILTGSIRELTQLASSEFQHGQLAKGLARLYRMRRQNLGSTDAAAAFYTALALARVRLEQLHDEPEIVAAGTAVEVSCNDGSRRWLTIDPPGFEDLPSTEEFTTVSSQEAKSVVNRRAGDTFSVTDTLGTVRTFKVERVINAYHRLLMISSEALLGSISPSESIAAMNLAAPDGGVDPTPLLQHVQKKEAWATENLKLYEEQAATLGLLARLLGTSTIDLIRNWPPGGPMLQVGGSQERERAQGAANLHSGRRILVDLSALTELAMMEQLPLLAGETKPMVTAITRDRIMERLAEARSVRPAGVAVARNGKLGIVEFTPEAHESEIAFLQRMLDAVTEHCEVVPSYGPLQLPENLLRLQQVVTDDEYSVLLTALEHNLVVLSLDLRFRLFAQMLGIVSTWPQIFLQSKRDQGRLLGRDYSRAVLQEFCSRRNFVTLQAVDLMVLTEQGTTWLNVGINRFREFLSEADTEFESAYRVTIEFFSGLYRRGHCQMGAFLELYSYLLEGLMRHPECPKDFDDRFLELLLGEVPPARKYRNAFERFTEFVTSRLSGALRPVEVKVSALYCSSPPFIRHGLRTSLNPFEAETVLATADREALGGQETTSNRPSHLGL